MGELLSLSYRLCLHGALTGAPLLYPAADFYEIYENKIIWEAPSSPSAIAEVGQWLKARLAVRGGQARWVSCNPCPWESPALLLLNPKQATQDTSQQADLPGCGSAARQPCHCTAPHLLLLAPRLMMLHISSLPGCSQ